MGNISPLLRKKDLTFGIPWNENFWEVDNRKGSVLSWEISEVIFLFSWWIQILGIDQITAKS